MTRGDLIDAFVRKHGWADAARTSVAGDASNRRYDRLTKADGQSAILMDAPRERGEDVGPFIHIAEHLKGHGLSAPAIFARDIDAGLLLIEDLSDALFARVLEQDQSLEAPLYEAAVDTLSALHAIPVPNVPTYDAALLTEAACLAFDWYLTAASGQDDAAKSLFSSSFNPLIKPIDAAPGVLALRDFHAENLIWLPERRGVARVGLLDFQDAMRCHPAYDLVSFLQDARRDVSPKIEAMMIDRYLDQNPHRADDFRRDYAILGVQRNLRILGVFARLCIRDGKQHYVDLIPRVWGHVQTNLQHPALANVKAHLDTVLPPPTPDILERLKSKCATLPPS